ncbi:hypothetical protein JKG47_22035 [Acidithiobacillus sp. MC6.1]|nr:hypothetical protein [Acidithiobacillus sp. MC6.1]
MDAHYRGTHSNPTKSPRFTLSPPWYPGESQNRLGMARDTHTRSFGHGGNLLRLTNGHPRPLPSPKIPTRICAQVASGGTPMNVTPAER